MSQSHHVAGGVSGVGRLQADVFHVDFPPRLHLQAEVANAVEAERALAGDGEVFAFLGCFPTDGSVVLSGDAEASGNQRFLAFFRFDDKAHFSCQNGIGYFFRAACVEAVVGVVASGDGGGQAVGGKSHLAAEPGKGVAMKGDGRVRSCGFVGIAQRGVQPAQAGLSPAFVVPVVGDRRAADHQFDGDFNRPFFSFPHENVALVCAVGGRGNVHSNPQGLHAAFGHGHGFAERFPFRVGPALIEALKSGGGDSFSLPVFQVGE